MNRLYSTFLTPPGMTSRVLLLVAGLAALTACQPASTASSPGTQLYISTDPAGASIICDSRAAPNPTPTTLTGLAPGTHLIIARKPGFTESRATVTIQPGERLTLDMKLDEIRGLVLIQSKPPGADVEIDNSNYGKTPLLVPNFPLGHHRVKISAPDHMPKTVDVTVEDRTPKQVTINLQSDTAKLVFESKPSGGQVTIDGTLVGKTPCVSERTSAGKHRVAITLQGHAPYQDELAVQAGEERTVSVALTPLPGKLSVVSIPPKARLYLNEQYKAETPFAPSAIPPGQYALRVEFPGYATQTSNITVNAGEETMLEFKLVKDSGTLRLSTQPPGVTVIMDGENRGVTPAVEQEPISGQLVIDRVPKGQHKLQLTKSGYLDLTATVEVLAAEEIILHKKLALRPVPFIPTIIIHTGPGAEHSVPGIIREKYDDGSIKLEIKPGIFRVFKASEILSTEPIKTP